VGVSAAAAGVVVMITVAFLPRQHLLVLKDGLRFLVTELLASAST